MKLPLSFLLLLFALPSLAQPKPEGALWQDKSLHQSGFVEANGVRLHYLDWGGAGRPLLFLADIGFTAHIFDDLAPRFTDQFRVFALTRRGHGQSEKAAGGYENRTLVQDIRAFMEKQGIARAVLAGHGVAGAEITHFALAYPARVEKLIYLDAAYDNEDTRLVGARYEEALQTLPPPPYPTRDTPNFDALRAWGRQRLGCWSEAMEAELRFAILRRANGEIEDAMPSRVESELRRGATLSASDLAQVRAPALSFYALDSIGSVFPWETGALSPKKRAAAQGFVEFGNLLKRDQIVRFKRGANRQVVELRDTPHLCFIAKRNEVVQKMRAFLLER